MKDTNEETPGVFNCQFLVLKVSYVAPEDMVNK